MLQLIELTKEWEQPFMDYQKAWRNEEFVPSSAQLIQHNFKEWLEENEAMKSAEFAYGRQLVPAHTLFLVDSECQYILGAINLRHELNQYLYEFGGHIGYGIRPEMRGKGYATKMLELALPYFQHYVPDATSLLITCDRGNEASEHVIKANGGIFQNEVYYEEAKVYVRRFLIPLI